MKTLLIAILLIVGCYTISHAQKINHKDLIGKWQEINLAPNEPQSALNFIDSSHATLSYGTFTMPFTYSLDSTITNATLMHLHMVNPTKQEKDVYWLMKIDSSLLKTQGDFTGNIPTKWNDAETVNNTGVMKKIQ